MMHFHWQATLPSPGLALATNLCPLLCFSSAPLRRFSAPRVKGFANFALLRSIHLSGSGQRELILCHCELLTNSPLPPSPSPPSIQPFLWKEPFPQTLSICSAVPLSFAAPAFHILFSFSAALITPVFSFNASALSLLWDLLTSCCSPCWSAVLISSASENAVHDSFRGHNVIFRCKHWRCTVCCPVWKSVLIRRIHRITADCGKNQLRSGKRRKTADHIGTPLISTNYD